MSFGAIAVCLIVATILAAIACALFLRYLARQRKRKSRALAATVEEYFRQRDTKVRADCMARPGGRFVVCIDSEPLQRLRYSHLIEVNLCVEVQRTCRLKIEKVYWRFPAPEKTGARAVSDPLETDEHAEQRAFVMRKKAAPAYEVSAAPWEQFVRVYNA